MAGVDPVGVLTEMALRVSDQSRPSKNPVRMKHGLHKPGIVQGLEAMKNIWPKLENGYV
jgi:hypothetical protein